MTDTSEKRFVERRSAYREEGDEDAGAEPTATVGAPAEPERAPAAEAAPGEAPSGPADELAALEAVEVPEPSFYELVQPLEVQALQFLGEIPLTPDGQRRVLPRWAKHVIDLLGILEERTRGNLAAEEAHYLEQMLADLRARYVKAAS